MTYTHLRKSAYIVFLWIITISLFEYKHAETLRDDEHKFSWNLALPQWDWELLYKQTDLLLISVNSA